MLKVHNEDSESTCEFLKKNKRCRSSSIKPQNGPWKKLDRTTAFRYSKLVGAMTLKETCGKTS